MDQELARRTSERAAFRRRRLARLVGIAIALAGVGVLVAYALGEEIGPSFGTPGVEKPPTTECSREEPPPAKPQRYRSAPDLSLEPGSDYSAVISTTCGDIAVDLVENQAPEAVANFVFLASQGFYDGLEWIRAERNFLIQTGDPNNDILTPPDGPGYSIPVDLPAKTSDYVYGQVVLAHEGPRGDRGSQFFIIVHDSPLVDDGRRGKPEAAGLQLLYTIFGEVSKRSYETIDKIARQPVRGGNDAATAVRPLVPIYVTSIRVEKVRT